MTDRPSPQAGGALIAFAVMAGTIGGGLLGQPTIGLLAGLAIGSAGALALWWADRSRAGR